MTYDYSTHLSRSIILYGSLFVAYVLAFGFSFLPDFGYLSKGTGCLVQNNQRTAAYSQNKVSYPGNNATSSCGNYMCVESVVNSTYADLDGYVLAAFTTGFSVYFAAAIYMFSLYKSQDKTVNSPQQINQIQKHDLLTSLLITILVPLLSVPMIFFMGADTVFDSYIFPLVIFLHLFMYSIGDWHEYDHAMFVISQTTKAITKRNEKENKNLLIDEYKYELPESYNFPPPNTNTYSTYRWMYVAMRFVVPWIVFALIVYVTSISFTHDVYWNTSSAKQTIDVIIGCFFSIIILNILYYMVRTMLNVYEESDISKEQKKAVVSWNIFLTYVWIYGINGLIITTGIEILYMVASGCKFSHY